MFFESYFNGQSFKNYIDSLQRTICLFSGIQLQHNTSYLCIIRMQIQIQKQGDKKFKEGKDNITTGIFQWSKDYASGAHNFEQAVKLYRQANKPEKALKALKELIACNQKMRDSWAVARNYQEMIDLYLNNFPQTSLEQLKQICLQAFNNFKMAESIDKGLQLMGRVAKQFMKRGQLNGGVEVLKSAYQASLQDQKSFKKKELFNQIIQVYLQNQIYFEAQRMYQETVKTQPINNDAAQCGLIVVLLILIQHQPNRAQKQMYQLSNYIQGFLQSDQCQAADELIKAYKKGDQEKFIKWTTKAAITCIFPVVIIQKIRTVKVPAAVVQAGEQAEAENKETIQKLLF